MVKVCSWCGKDMQGDSSKAGELEISHGMCEDCEALMNAELDGIDNEVQEIAESSKKVEKKT